MLRITHRTSMSALFSGVLFACYALSRVELVDGFSHVVRKRISYKYQQLRSMSVDDDDTFINDVPITKYCPTGKLNPPVHFDGIPKGWVGGFLDKHKEMEYPRLHPDLSSIPLMDNMQNIDKLQRQMKVVYPWFSWQEVLGDETTRSYKRLAEYISRLGYDDKGRIWSIICPQMGTALGSFGEMNAEVTVTGCRGWVNEEKRELAAEMGVMGQIWISTDPNDNKYLMALSNFMGAKMDFPFQKSHSIRVATHEQGNPRQDVFRLKNGICQDYLNPDFAESWDDTYMTTNVDVQIGAIIKNEGISDENTGVVDAFNELILGLFNVSTGNMLKRKNILSWNIWMNPPEIVDQTEWHDHAEKWRHSLEVNHSDPKGITPNNLPRYFNGDFVPIPRPGSDEKMLSLVKDFLEKFHDIESAEKRSKDPEDLFTKIDHGILLKLKVGKLF